MSVRPGSAPSRQGGGALPRLRRTVKRRLQRSALLALTIIWVMLWGNVSWGNVVAGLILAAGILLVFPLPPVSLGIRIHPWAFVVLLVRFNIDLVVSSLQMAYRAIVPWWQPRGRVLRVPLRSDNDLICVITAEMTALVPGTVVIDVSASEKWLLLHVFHAPDERTLAKAVNAVQAQEIRVIKALARHEKYLLAGREVPAQRLSGAERAAAAAKAAVRLERSRANQARERAAGQQEDS